MLSHRDTIFNMDAVKARRKGLVQELRKLARSRDVQAVRDDSGWAKVKAMYEDTQTHRHTDTHTHTRTHTRLTVSDSVGGDHAEFHYRVTKVSRKITSVTQLRMPPSPR